MFRASAGRYLLLSAVVFLQLWSTFCIVASRHGLPAPPSHWVSDTSPEVFIQNQPHYKSQPVLDVAKTPKQTIRYARDNFGSVWILNSGYFRLRKYYPDGLIAWPEFGSRSSVLSQVKAAERAKTLGRAVAALQFGKPFQATGEEPHDWNGVWNLKGEPVPETMGSKKWLDIRSQLQKGQAYQAHRRR